MQNTLLPVPGVVLGSGQRSTRVALPLLAQKPAQLAIANRNVPVQALAAYFGAAGKVAAAFLMHQKTGCILPCHLICFGNPWQ